MKGQPPRERDVRQPRGERLRQALAFVKARLEALDSLPREPPFNDEYTMWERVTLAGLQDYFGGDSDACQWVNPQRSFYMGWDEAEQASFMYRQYQERLTNQRVGLKSILARYQLVPPVSGSNTDAVPRSARAFISHGGERPSLTLIQDFLRALGVEPIVVEKRASEGREVHENVDSYRKQADFALILLTKDFQDKGGVWRPSGSVEVELGELRQQFGSRVIYLKEEGVKLPAMASTPVHETFTEDNMAPAFMKIVTELHGWGWLTVSAPEGRDD